MYQCYFLNYFCASYTWEYFDPPALFISDTVTLRLLSCSVHWSVKWERACPFGRE